MKTARSLLQSVMLAGAFEAGAHWGAMGLWKRTFAVLITCFVAVSVLDLADLIGVTHGKGKGR